MNELKIFENKEFGAIRTIEIDNKPYFVGKDVADILGYQNGSRDINRHVDEEDRHKTMLFDGNQDKETILINESGLYSLILSSKLPKAKQFKHWVTAEVLPSIRKTGGYVSNDDMFINTYLPYADEQTRALFKSTLATVKSLNSQIEQDKPKVLFADAVSASKTSILIGDLAKLLKQNGYDIGQKRLFEKLRQDGYLMKGGSSQNMPTQKAMEMGLFQVKETAVTHSDGHVTISKTVKVTGKGQQYFINRLLRI